MTRLLLVCLLSGCAIGTVTDRQLSGYALGHAEIQRCRVVQPCVADQPPIKVCDTIKGGSFSSGFAGVLEAAVAALAAWLTL